MINHLPTQNVEKVLENTDKYVRILDNKLKQLHKQYGAKFEIQRKYPAFICEQTHPFIRDLGLILQKSNFSGAGFSSDAPVFDQRNIPTVLLGPGSILQAHEPNEFITDTEVRIQ
jgi:acetylornithine deacetylase